MSPVGWKDHTHPCVDCDGNCEAPELCDSCASYQQAVTANDIAATSDHDISRHERFTRGTPIGRSERRAFDRDMHGE